MYMVEASVPFSEVTNGYILGLPLSIQGDAVLGATSVLVEGAHELSIGLITE